MNFKKYISKRPLLLVALTFFVAVLVFMLLLSANFSFLGWTGYFEKNDPYKDSIILFFHSECLYCAKVDDYLAANKVEAKVDFVRLNVLQSDYNRNELQDKAQLCGLEVETIGVPFLWDGPSKRCVIGYIDIIDFFRQKLKKP